MTRRASPGRFDRFHTSATTGGPEADNDSDGGRPPVRREPIAATSNIAAVAATAAPTRPRETGLDRSKIGRLARASTTLS